MRTRLVEEKPDHYVMHDGQAAFRVFKAGLSDSVHQKIRAMADGGIVARAPTGERLDSNKDLAAKVAEERRHRIQKEQEWDEEGDAPQKPKPPAQPPKEPSFVERAGQFAQSLATKLPHFAEGGGVSDAGYEGYDPYALPPRKDNGPVVYVSQSPTPGAVPVPASSIPNDGAGGAGGSDSMGAGGGPGAVVQQDRGSAGASGGPSDSQIPQHEAIQPRAARPPVSPALPPGVVPKDGAESTTPVRDPVRGRSVPSVGGPAGAGFDADAATREKIAAEQAKTGAEVAAARENASALAAKADRMREIALDEKQTLARAHEATSSAMAQYQASLDDMKKVDISVDPGRFWATRTTGQKVIGYIGLALGAIGAGTDGVNRAAQMMSQAIDRDIEAQKAEHTLRLEKGRTSMAATQNIYAMNRNLFQDDLAAVAASKATALELAANQAEQITAKYASPVAQANGQALVAQLRMAGEKFKNEAQDAKATAALKWATAEKERAKGSGLGEGETKELHDVTAAAADAVGLIRSIRGTLEKTQSAIPGKTAINQNFGTDSANLDTDVASLVVKLKDIYKLGQLGPADNELLKEAIGDPKAVFTTREGTKRAKLDRLEEIIRRSIANQRAARGVQ